VKREGDKRAPAGVFRLLEVYGFASREEADIVSFPYRHLTAGVEGIDDPSSRYYNRLVDGASVHRDWKSSEQMRRSGEVYRWGVVVGHNWNQIPGAGSCIFLHIWERPGEPTSGCTAMPADELLKVIRWLDQTKRPLLVQLPEPEYRRVRELWGLP
jgi:D-alanyl-D-alanine dipeptidase